MLARTSGSSTYVCYKVEQKYFYSSGTPSLRPQGRALQRALYVLALLGYRESCSGDYDLCGAHVRRTAAIALATPMLRAGGMPLCQSSLLKDASYRRNTCILWLCAHAVQTVSSRACSRCNTAVTSYKYKMVLREGFEPPVWYGTLQMCCIRPLC